MLCGDFKYLPRMILWAGDTEALVKLFPSFGFFICFIMTIHWSKRLKEMLKFWKVRIMEGGYWRMLILILAFQVIVKKFSIFLCFVFYVAQNEGNNNECLMQMLGCLYELI